MAGKREKLILPSAFIAEVDALMSARGWHQKRLSVEADVSEARLRTRNPEAYEMVVRMLGAGNGDGDGSPRGRGT